MRQSGQIRKAFIDFFKEREHEHIKASSLAPLGDPSLLFTNSGMVQFKKVFTGQEQIETKRAVTCQKSMRAGGKHNDLENVGYTTRHHTLFEMLGNFSFGDYFKEEAIVYAWELLTKVYLLNPDKLLFTVHATDQESEQIWRKVSGVSADKIITINGDDNFWSMGELGPCGPCSEIFYDYGESIPGGPPGSLEQDGPRYVEIWNLVFMQYEQVALDKRVPLAKRSIDTGMGLERLASVLQGKTDNYQIDMFERIAQKAALIAGLPYEPSPSYKIVSDHIRAITFLIAEGILPDNTGRSYVLRKIMRRAIKHSREISSKRGLLSELVPTVIDVMGEAYPEIIPAQQKVMDCILQEEERFEHTLNRGCLMLNKLCKEIKDGETCSGEIAFELYDTYGFPIELTQDILKERNITVDIGRFNACMQRQQALARAPDCHLELKQLQPTEFLRETRELDSAQVICITKDGQLVDSVTEPGAKCTVFLDKTPFYAESGGQVGDTGTISAHNLLLRVSDTKKLLAKLHAHEAILEKGKLSQGQYVKAAIDWNNRGQIAANHSATHLLNQALKEALSQSAAQKGSLVKGEQLRFDFNYSKNLSPEEINTIENKINEVIISNLPVSTSIKTYEEAIQSGALALAGEEYESKVRVVSIGNDKMQFSSELCGGTHVKSTGEIGIFKVTSVSSIASGIKRITAVTGQQALKHIQNLSEVVQTMESKLKSPLNKLLPNIDLMLERVKALETENRVLKIQSVKDAIKGISPHETKYGQLLYKDLKDIELQVLKEALLNAIKLQPSSMLVLTSATGENVMIAACVGKNLESELGANALIEKIAAQLGAKGGGNKSIAHAGVNKEHFDSQKLLNFLLSDLASTI